MFRLRRLVPFQTDASATAFPSSVGSPTVQGSHAYYRRDIDGLRAFAIIPVVLFHAGVTVFNGGFVGVDVFFVISGYLITIGLLHDPSIVRFYERRLRRIFPALFVMIALTTLVALFILLPGDLVAYAKSIVAASLFSSNMYFWRQSGYFATISETWPMLHTWSLGVEEQFYIFFPIVILLLRSKPRLYLTISIIITIVVSYVLAQFCVRSMKDVLAFYLMPTRAWELLIGSLLALHIVPVTKNALVRAAAAAIGMVAIIVPVLAYSSTTSFPGMSAIPPVIGAALILWAGQDGEHALSPLLGWSVFRFVGLISYSLYLWHWPVLALVRYVSIDPIGPATAILAVIASVALATLSWRYVETPFRRVTAKRTIWIASVGAIVAMTVVGAIVIRDHGLSGRFSPQVVSLNADQDTSWRCLPTAFVSFGSYYACPIGLPSNNPRNADIVLWGDSHAQMYVPALRRAIGARGALLVNAYGCAPTVTAAATPECGRIQSRNFTSIASLPARIVILAQNWPQYRDELGRLTGRKSQADERFVPAITRLKETVQALRRAGKQVYVVSAIPNPEYELPSVVSRDIAFYGHPRHPIGVTSADFNADYANVMAAETLLAATGQAGIIDTRKSLCSARACRYIVGSHSLFADHGHITEHFADTLGPTFKAALE